MSPRPIKTVRITLEVIGATDRDSWEWGDGLATFLAGELNEQNEDNGFGPITVECMDVEQVKDDK